MGELSCLLSTRVSVLLAPPPPSLPGKEGGGGVHGGGFFFLPSSIKFRQFDVPPSLSSF